MGNFGDAVASLLDTYARCLSLLGDFTKSRKDEGEQQTAKRRKRSSSKSNSVVSASAAPNAVPANVLRRAIQNARAKVLRSYSSKLQRRGQSFERGDVASRGSLKNIVGKLKVAVSNLMGTLSRDPHHAVDYASLISLSNSSQLDAVRTMSDLSHRIKRQPSTASKLSKASSSRSSKTSRSAKITKAHTSSSASVGDGAVPSSVRSRQRTDGNHRRSRDSRGGDNHRRMQHSAHRSKDVDEGDLDRRVSIITTSSNSTKIGELRRHEGRGGRRPAAYPPGMHRYDSSHSERKKASWWRSMF